MSIVYQTERKAEAVAGITDRYGFSRPELIIYIGNTDFRPEPEKTEGE